MGTCTPKTSLTYPRNYPSPSHLHTRESIATGGTGTSGTSGSSGNEDDEVRNYNWERKGSGEENYETKQFPFTDSLPKNGSPAEIHKERLNDEINVIGTHNGRNSSLLREHQNIRETV